LSQIGLSFLRIGLLGPLGSFPFVASFVLVSVQITHLFFEELENPNRVLVELM